MDILAVVRSLVEISEKALVYLNLSRCQYWNPVTLSNENQTYLL